MACFSVSACLLAGFLVIVPSLAAICPDSCKCTTTQDGLHRVICDNLAEVYKYSLHEKRPNINILVLSHNNITKVTNELDRLTELVTLDLSTNGISDVTKFLHNARKLVHLNLANNRIARLSLTHLPTSVSSLDLTNNLLQDVPSNLGHLAGLEHLELDGNPLDCSCENIVARDRLLKANVHIDSAMCETPVRLKNRSWLELKTKDICKASKMDYLDMLGDQPIDAVQIGKETTDLRSMSLVASNDLGEGKVIGNIDPVEDDDSMQYFQVGHYNSPSSLIEGSGSGDGESTTMTNIMEPIHEKKIYGNIMAEEDGILAADISHTTEDPIEGSGEGSGFGLQYRFNQEYEEPIEVTAETTTRILEDLNPGPVIKIFNDDINATSEFPLPPTPSIYEGGSNWHTKDEPVLATDKAVTQEAPKDTTVSEQMRVTKPSDDLAQPTTNEKVTHKTGTYVCIALIVVLLVGLIGFAIIKGQMRKRKDRRLLRQQKRDVEKASKEMVDMNKSLLGKPALSDAPSDRIVNGKYELVPTHEAHQKKGENGFGNGLNHSDNKDDRTGSPRDTNQNKRSSIDNNLLEDNELPQHETSFESDPTSPGSRKDRHSLSSDDIFVPAHDDETPRLNGNASDVSHPLINGDQNTDSDFLSPSREYVPVYSPDMGRVRIKMSETPKPKTPVLVTRSRSNAGDIIITPAVDVNVRKSTT